MSEVRADTFTDAAGTGAPDFTQGIEVGGVAVSAANATALAQNLYSPKSGDYTILDNDNISIIGVTSGASNRTMSLPTAADNTNRKITIAKVDSGVGKVVITAEGSETINGEASVYLDSIGDTITLVCDGSVWYISAQSLSEVVLFDQSNAGLSGSDADVDVGTLTLSPGTYRMKFGGLARVTHAGAPTSADCTLKVTTLADVTLGVDATIGVPIANATSNRGYVGEAFTTVLASETTIKLRANSNTVGGTISARTILDAYILAQKISHATA